MTTEQVADGTLDAQVAEKVLGWQWWRSSASGRRTLFPPDKVPEWFTRLADGTEPLTHDHGILLPRFSTNFPSAWQVFESLTQRGWMALVKYDPERERNRWTCWVSWPTPNDPISKSDAVQAATDSPALSICLAAVRAVEAAGGVCR